VGRETSYQAVAVISQDIVKVQQWGRRERRIALYIIRR